MRSLILNLVFLALAGTTSIAVAASKPVILTSAPIPELSEAAWAQVVARHKVEKTTEFKVAIHVKNGLVIGAQIVDPCGADLVEQDVRNWVLKKWRFEPDFSGDKVQLMAFNLESKKEQETRAAKARRAADAHHGLFLRSPAPPFTPQLLDEVKDYEIANAKATGVLVRMVVKNGQITDIRTVDAKGPSELSLYTTRWVLDHWQFKPDVTGVFLLPIIFLAH